MSTRAGTRIELIIPHDAALHGNLSKAKVVTINPWLPAFFFLSFHWYY
jgi:hypothetical protein